MFIDRQDTSERIIVCGDELIDQSFCQFQVSATIDSLPRAARERNPCAARRNDAPTQRMGARKLNWSLQP